MVTLVAAPGAAGDARYPFEVFDRFGDEAQAVLARADDESRRLGHNHLGTEHLILGLLGARSGPASQVLRAAGATLDGCRSKVAELVGPPSERPWAGERELTDRAKRALLRADRLSLRRLDADVEPGHILASLLDVEGTAGQVLRGVSVDVVELRASVSKMLDGARLPAPPPDDQGHHEPRCTACGALLGNGPASRILKSEDEQGHELRLIVVYCASCGGVFGVSPV